MSKVAAQNCRKRKLDQLDDLQVGAPSFCVKQKKSCLNKNRYKTDTLFPYSIHFKDWSKHNVPLFHQASVNEQKQEQAKEGQLNKQLKVTFVTSASSSTHNFESFAWYFP